MPYVNYSQPTFNREQVYEASAAGAIFVSVLMPTASPIAEGRLSVQEIRRNRLLKNRNLFFAFAAVDLLALVLSVASNTPWEPAAALFSCLLGIAVVFAMKVRDAR